MHSVVELFHSTAGILCNIVGLSHSIAEHFCTIAEKFRSSAGTSHTCVENNFFCTDVPEIMAQTYSGTAGASIPTAG
jgi:hypothetical protein